MTNNSQQRRLIVSCNNEDRGFPQLVIPAMSDPAGAYHVHQEGMGYLAESSTRENLSTSVQKQRLISVIDEALRLLKDDDFDD